MELNVILEVFFVLLIIIFAIYLVYTRYIKKSSSNNSNFIFTPKNMFNYSPGLLSFYLNEKADLNPFNGHKNGFKATLLDLINKNYIIFLNPNTSNSTKKKCGLSWSFR